MRALEIKPDEQGDLYCLLPYVFYTGGAAIWLDGKFTADDLERLSAYMRARQQREAQAQAAMLHTNDSEPNQH